MRIFEKGFWLSGHRSAVFKVKRTLILNNVDKEFYHQPVSRGDQIVSVTRDLKSNEMTVTVNIDKFKSITI